MVQQSNDYFIAARLIHEKIDLNEGFKYGTICDGLNNSHLLKDNALFRCLRSDNVLYLSHQTKWLEEILHTHTIKPGWGCLSRVLYTTPIYVDGTNIRRDNFFYRVLSHQQNNTIIHDEIIAKIEKKYRYFLWGENYLKAGILLKEIAGTTYLANSPGYKKAHLKVKRILKSKEFNTVMRKSYDYAGILNAASGLAQVDMFFAYIYYESLCQILMLSCVDDVSSELALLGEFNAKCYYDILNLYNTIQQDRFDAASFSPDYDQLNLILQSAKNPGIDLDFDDELILKNIAENISQILNNLGECGDIEDHLLGQFLRSELDSDESRYLMAEFDKVILDFRLKNDIDIVINTATLKPEVGLVYDPTFSVIYYSGGVTTPCRLLKN